ncbi:hypothetical protein IFM89_018182 [Coptis chinensis]|uniref:ribonuclease P n=1 Tax=Coptis chinensis TaxID=261450 RepID=A0A835I356_9MAGN|nr:hypothetical protein IFM89_018182 [Coptis chinensis]
MAFSTHISPSYLLKNSTLFNLFTRTPYFLSNHNTNRVFLHFLQYPSFFSPNTIFNLPMNQNHSLSTSVQCATMPMPIGRTMSKKAQNKAYRQSPEGVLHLKLDMCSKHGDLVEALRLYDEARRERILISKPHYNSLLYLCSCSNTSGSLENSVSDEKLGLSRGFEIFKQMGIDGIAPNEATFTSVARLAAMKEDPEMAFELVKKMMSVNIPPRLRSYEPALLGFCKKGEADKAYEVDAHMLASGICPEEQELAALLRVSVDVGKAEKVYEMLHRLRSSVRQVSESTAEIVQEWFKSRAATEVGLESWDVEKVKEGIVKGGGGWHGQGWLGKGEWKVVKSEMDENGVCGCCGETLVCVDIDPLETENFAKELSRLACQKEVQANFNSFEDWIRRNGPFDAVIDGANVSLNNSHSFSFFQLNSVVERVKRLSPTKRLPLIILHNSRVVGGPANNPNNKKLLEKWRRSGVLYTTPTGSNDDWYWLYAAVSSKCLLVTNDEMRDHLFQLLGTSFFPRWKEKHQVRYTASREGVSLQMPPLYSMVIQESERGNWHIPMVTTDDIDTPRQWVLLSVFSFQNGHVQYMLSCYDAELRYDCFKHLSSKKKETPNHNEEEGTKGSIVAVLGLDTVGLAGLIAILGDLVGDELHFCNDLSKVLEATLDLSQLKPLQLKDLILAKFISCCYVVVLVTMQAQKETPSDLNCKDKFLLQNVTIPNGIATNDISFEMAAKLLGPPARFESSKLKVVFMEDEMHKGTGIIPRTYALSHCDLTANLTLAISNVINLDQLRGWYNRDDVVAEWNSVNEETCLHVHCHVSGPNVMTDLLAEFRYHIFTKELPLVLKAVLYGDSKLFKEHPELMEALVLVYFHSSSNKYNRVECWGALKDAAQGRKVGQRQNLLRAGEENHHPLEKWRTPKSIFHALFAFLL